MTVHPLPIEPDAPSGSLHVFDALRSTTGVEPSRRRTSIRRNWVHAGATLESGTADRRAA